MANEAVDPGSLGLDPMSTVPADFVKTFERSEPPPPPAAPPAQAKPEPVAAAPAKSSEEPAAPSQPAPASGPPRFRSAAIDREIDLSNPEEVRANVEMLDGLTRKHQSAYDKSQAEIVRLRTILEERERQAQSAPPPAPAKPTAALITQDQVDAAWDKAIIERDPDQYVRLHKEARALEAKLHRQEIEAEREAATARLAAIEGKFKPLIDASEDDKWANQYRDQGAEWARAAYPDVDPDKFGGMFAKAKLLMDKNNIELPPTKYMLLLNGIKDFLTGGSNATANVTNGASPSGGVPPHAAQRAPVGSEPVKPSRPATPAPASPGATKRVPDMNSILDAALYGGKR